MLGHFGIQVALALRLYVNAADGASLGPMDALEHVQAATAAATDEISAELLLAMAFVESRYDRYWVSRVEGRKRRYSRYGLMTPPKRLNKAKSLYCGPLQTRALTWEHCLQQRDDLFVAYRAAAGELTSWLRDRRVRGDVTRALAGYGCGNHGVRTGKCNRYQGRVLFRARQLGAEFEVEQRAARSRLKRARSDA